MSLWTTWGVRLRERNSLLMSDTRWRGSTNAFYGVADYLVLPLGMLFAAPFLLRHLGAAQYGVWILASATVSSGGTVSGSFGDAVIKYVGSCRGRRDWLGIARIVRSMMSINLILSGILAIALWYMAPYVARHIVKVDLELQKMCLLSLRIGSGLLLTKSVESVFISTLRAFEAYGSTVLVSIGSRAAILASAIVLTRCGRNVVWIMVATLFISASGTWAQALALRTRIGSFSLMPSWHRKTVLDIAAFGSFSWLQAISGIAFSYGDRLFVGFFMGAPAVAYYGLCVQAAQPIHGLISSGMHFLFPHLSSRYPVAPLSEIRRKIILAFKVNGVLVFVLALPLIVLGSRFLTRWVGPAFSQQSLLIFPTIVCSFALLGMNVTAHYALLAVGHVRTVTYLNLLAGMVMLITMAILIPKHGLQGAALARLVYGPITCLAYLYLWKVVGRREPRPFLQQRRIYNATTTGTD
jgi:O-antigen/teichoic acid export membrane protein